MNFQEQRGEEKMEKLVLTDNTELEIMDGASLDYIRIQTDNFAAVDLFAGAL